MLPDCVKEGSPAEFDGWMTSLAVQYNWNYFGRIGELALTSRTKAQRALPGPDGSDKADSRGHFYSEVALKCNDVIFVVQHHGQESAVEYTAGAMPTPVDPAEVRKMLILNQYKAAVLVQDSDGLYPLHVALTNGLSNKLIEALLQAEKELRKAGGGAGTISVALTKTKSNQTK
jgi:hypothetical protein